MSTTHAVQFNSRRQSNWNRNQNTVAFASAIKMGPITHTVLVALMVTILGLIYLTQATHATSYNYAAQEIDAEIATLSEQKSDLEVENARLTALESVKNSDVAKAMVTPSETTYINQ